MEEALQELPDLSTDQAPAAPTGESEVKEVESEVKDEIVVDKTAKDVDDPDAPPDWSKVDPKYRKALQKEQQERANATKLATRLMAERAQLTQPKPEETQSVLKDMYKERQELLDKMETAAEDDLVSARDQARLSKLQIRIEEERERIAQSKVQEQERSQQAIKMQEKAENDWKAKNPEIADQFKAIVEKTWQRTEEENPDLDPQSPEFLVEWRVNQRLIAQEAKAAKAKPTQTVNRQAPPVPKPNPNTPRTPVPNGTDVKQVSGSAPKPGQAEHDPFSDNPIYWLTQPVGRK